VHKTIWANAAGMVSACRADIERRAACQVSDLSLVICVHAGAAALYCTVMRVGRLSCWEDETKPCALRSVRVLVASFPANGRPGPGNASMHVT
jgi:hypothetical protein